MKFGYTIIYVTDVEKTVEFYTHAFELEQRFIHESKQYAELNTGETTLAFASNAMAESNAVDFIKNDLQKPAAGFEIALISENVKQSYDHAILNGAINVKEPSQKPWGQEVAYARDLNGILIEICSPVE